MGTTAPDHPRKSHDRQHRRTATSRHRPPARTGARLLASPLLRGRRTGAHPGHRHQRLLLPGQRLGGGRLHRPARHPHHRGPDRRRRVFRRDRLLRRPVTGARHPHRGRGGHRRVRRDGDGPPARRTARVVHGFSPPAHRQHLHQVPPHRRRARAHRRLCPVPVHPPRRPLQRIPAPARTAGPLQPVARGEQPHGGVQVGVVRPLPPAAEGRGRGRQRPGDRGPLPRRARPAERLAFRIRPADGRQRLRGGDVGLRVQGDLPLLHAQPLCRAGLFQAQGLCRRLSHDGTHLRRRPAGRGPLRGDRRPVLPGAAGLARHPRPAGAAQERTAPLERRTRRPAAGPPGS